MTPFMKSLWKTIASFPYQLRDVPRCGWPLCTRAVFQGAPCNNQTVGVAAVWWYGVLPWKREHSFARIVLKTLQHGVGIVLSQHTLFPVVVSAAQFQVMESCRRPCHKEGQTKALHQLGWSARQAPYKTWPPKGVFMRIFTFKYAFFNRFY